MNPQIKSSQNRDNSQCLQMEDGDNHIQNQTRESRQYPKRLKYGRKAHIEKQTTSLESRNNLNLFSRYSCLLNLCIY